MTVGELIEKLMQFSLDMKVVDFWYKDFYGVSSDTMPYNKDHRDDYGEPIVRIL